MEETNKYLEDRLVVDDKLVRVGAEPPLTIRYEVHVAGADGQSIVERRYSAKKTAKKLLSWPMKSAPTLAACGI